MLSNEELFSLAEFIQVIISLILPLIVITGAYALYLNKAANKGSKNVYMDILKNDIYIRDTLKEIGVIKFYKITLLIISSSFIFAGVVYANIGT